jgi:hypothetical protein
MVGALWGVMTRRGYCPTSAYVPGACPPAPLASTKSNSSSKGEACRKRRVTRLPSGSLTRHVVTGSGQSAGGSDGREASFSYKANTIGAHLGMYMWGTRAHRRSNTTTHSDRSYVLLIHASCVVHRQASHENRGATVRPNSSRRLLS